jgi:EamA domain-containing membrane protein RarD
MEETHLRVILAVIVWGMTSFHGCFKYMIEPEISMVAVVMCLSYGLYFASTRGFCPCDQIV